MHSTLTETAIRAAKPGTVWDGSLKHFGLRTTPAGSKSFIILVASGRRRVVGQYPTITLKQAREKARQLLAEKTLGRFQPQTTTWQAALTAYLEQVERKKRPRTHREYKRALNRYFPFGTMRLANISRPVIVAKLDKLADRPAQQSRALVYCKTFLNWCVQRGHLEQNPCTLSAQKQPSRERVLSDAEIKHLWRATGLFADYTKLLLLTGQRRGELRLCRKEKDTLIVPANVAKNGREAILPFSGHCQRLWRAYPSFAWSREKRNLDEATGVTDWTLHDLRRTFATIHARIGTPPHIIERLLNHASGQISGVAAIYNRHSFLPEMTVAMTNYEKEIRKIAHIEPRRIAA